MCTLTYLPFGDGGFLFTSNRDESPRRKQALPPVIREIGGQEVLYPVDGKAGGTWVAVAQDRRTVCLMNGAFKPHAMGGEWRISRGLMVLDSFAYATAEAFFREYELQGIEPFTYVSVETRENGLMIGEYRWDGEHVYEKDYDAGRPHIWSSAQLYRPEVIAWRERWFREWLEKHPDFSLDAIRDFHRFGGEGDIYNDIRMNRDGLVRTVSTTAIENGTDAIRMHYDDLLTDEKVTKSLSTA